MNDLEWIQLPEEIYQRLIVKIPVASTIGIEPVTY